MIDPAADRALYRQLADDLRARIRDGRLAPGTLLPSESSLGYEYQVGRNTVRGALRLLAAEGLIETQAGSRARVRTLREVTVIEVDPGCTITARMPTPDEQREERIPPGVPMLVIQDGPIQFAYPADRHQLRFRAGRS